MLVERNDLYEISSFLHTTDKALNELCGMLMHKLSVLSQQQIIFSVIFIKNCSSNIIASM